jgi:hypothetical protein
MDGGNGTRAVIHPISIMSKQPHHNRGAESMGGANSGRRTGAEPRLQSGAGMGSKKTNAGRKKSPTKPRSKAA